MGSELTTIKTAYEQEGMSVEEIAENQDLEVTAVKAGLMSVSSKYRRDCGGMDGQQVEDRLNFSDDELARVNEVILDLALGAEDDHLRFKAATYIRDDKKGRKEVAKGLGGNQFNVFMINEKLKEVRAMKETIMPKQLKGPVDV